MQTDKSNTFNSHGAISVRYNHKHKIWDFGDAIALPKLKN